MTTLPERPEEITYRKHVKPLVDEYLAALKTARLAVRRDVGRIELRGHVTPPEGEHVFEVMGTEVNEARKWGADPAQIRTVDIEDNPIWYQVGRAALQNPSQRGEVLEKLRKTVQRLSGSHSRLVARLNELERVRQGLREGLDKGEATFTQWEEFCKKHDAFEQKVRQIRGGAASPLFLRSLIQCLERTE